MKIAAGIVLVAALVLFGVTAGLRGNPLGYRGSLAVVRELVGSAELRVAGERPDRARVSTLIDLDTEIRSAGFSMVMLDTPAGRVHVYDSSALRSRKASAPAQPLWYFDVGRIRVEVDSAGGLAIGPMASAAYVELLPGSYELTADGKGMMAGLCVDGTALIHEGDGRPTEVKAGQVFLLTPLAPAVVTSQPPEINLSAKITPRSRAGELTTLSGQVTPGGRLYVNGELTYPDSGGEFVTVLAPGTEQVVIVAEDIAGKAESTTLAVPKLP